MLEAQLADARGHAKELERDVIASQAAAAASSFAADALHGDMQVT